MRFRATKNNNRKAGGYDCFKDRGFMPLHVTLSSSATLMGSLQVNTAPLKPGTLAQEKACRPRETGQHQAGRGWEGGGLAIFHMFGASGKN
ncbi:hypothetical protein RRG08_043732 [Elysia crispata]|uniref:Uncharacterized protein n=1 Tax=Elysia crispata TaxID=231223 RepID=A0AAE1DJ89_9GAST|nr:hypothetical protein RRG08_043732 [Elysia crispata]